VEQRYIYAFYLRFLEGVFQRYTNMHMKFLTCSHYRVYLSLHRQFFLTHDQKLLARQSLKRQVILKELPLYTATGIDKLVKQGFEV